MNSFTNDPFLQKQMILQMLSSHPDGALLKKIAESLFSVSAKAYLAGGSIRDALLGRTPKDLDLVTDATEMQIKSLFPKRLSIGEKFGIFMIQEKGRTLELAQFRKDGIYTDGRRPESISMGTPLEDAQRRDFTINALFFDLQDEHLLDFVNGISDIKARVIRTVGEPELRFSEDYLRVLRAVRFASQLEFQIEPKTVSAMMKASHQLPTISSERRLQELYLILRGKGWAGALEILVQTKILNHLWSTAISWPLDSETLLKHWNFIFQSQYNKVLDVNKQAGGEDEFLLSKFFLPALLISTNFLEEFFHEANISKPEKKSLQRLSRHIQMKHNFWRLRKAEQYLLWFEWEFHLLGDYLCQLDLQWQKQWLILSSEINIKFSKNRLPEALVQAHHISGLFKGLELGRALKEAYCLQLELDLDSVESIVQNLNRGC